MMGGQLETIIFATQPSVFVVGLVLRIQELGLFENGPI